MAQKMQTLYIDDIDGSEAEGTVRFGLDGAGYEIDLSAAHSQELRTALQEYIAHAREAAARAGPAGPAAAAEGAPAPSIPTRFARRPGAGHRHQGARPGASRYRGQIPQAHRAVRAQRPDARSYDEA
jgi:hypothetical protein